ncbi:unnamed protein product, partial [Mesorhabditis belari]|uniref:RecQ-mediated genome instability protein 1 n=1 Tax=Mesorhabditis belari TaxID=2138241 RepID=A0AAF3EZH9_9BILA
MSEKLVRLWLQKHHINVKGEWLRAAIEWTSISQPSINEKQLQIAILKQVLFSNLSDSCDPPVKIPTFAKQIILPKQHLFQVIMVLDISRSLYEQYRELTNKKEDLSWFTCEENNETTNETEPLSKPNRMLRIELSDGAVNLAAIIYGGNISIDERTPPGTKLLTRCRVRCRHGVMFLNQDNCQVLGGECAQLYKDRLVFLEEKLEIKNSARKQPKKRTTEDGNLTISPFLKPKNADAQSELDEVGDSKLNSTNTTLHTATTSVKNDPLHSIDEDLNKSLDTIPCTPILSRKSLNKVFDDTNVFRVPILPPASNPQAKVAKLQHEEADAKYSNQLQVNESISRSERSIVEDKRLNAIKPSMIETKTVNTIAPPEVDSKNASERNYTRETMTFVDQSRKDQQPLPVNRLPQNVKRAESWLAKPSETKVLSVNQPKEDSQTAIVPLMALADNPSRSLNTSSRMDTSESWLAKRSESKVLPVNQPKEDSQTAIVPLMALADNPSRSLNTSSRMDTSGLLDTSREIALLSTRNVTKRSSKELEKAAKGTRAITEYLSILGERPMYHRHSVTSAGDDMVPKIEETDERNTKATTRNVIPTTRRSLYATLAKSMAKSKKVADEKNLVETEAHSTTEVSFHTPAVRGKSGVSPFIPEPPNINELHQRAEKSVGDDVVHSRSLRASFKDSCVGTTPLLTKQYPVVHHRFVEKRDASTSPFPVFRKHDQTTASTSILKSHTGSKQLTAPKKNPASANEVGIMGRGKQFVTSTPTSGAPPPHDALAPERKIKKVQLISPEKSPRLNRSLSALSASGGSLTHTFPVPPNAQGNQEHHHNVNSNVPNLHSFAGQSKKTLNEAVRESVSQPRVSHQLDLGAALQYKTMEIYENRSLLVDLLRQRRFWMLSKRVTVVPLCSKLLDDLRAGADRWCLKVLLTDESAAGVMCVASQELLINMLGFDVSYCKMLSMDRRLNEAELNRCKQRALDVMKAFTRLDIVFMLEVSRNSNEPPVITGITQLCEAAVPAQTSVFFHQAMSNFE